MTRVLKKRLPLYLLTAWVAVTVNFAVPRLMPGNPAELLLGRLQAQGTVPLQSLRAIETEFGLRSNAGILTQGRLEALSIEDWDDTMRTDLRSVFLFCRLVVPGMVCQRWGRVINIASQLGLIGGVELTHYSAAKAGVIGFTKALAREVGPYNVTANCIAPGPIDTAMVARISDEWKTAKRNELPLGRFGTPEEVAPTALLLASDPGGNLFTGQTLGPNSGDVMP
jgi:3-oxoacyl-[acyl-carrier protein] reductase